MSLITKMRNIVPGTDSSTCSSETNEECFKTGNYLRHLSGQDRETNLIILEHNYSKPWTWKPETSFAKPTRTLFTTPRPSLTKTVYSPDDEVDIETVEDSSSSQLQCVPEADDCARYAEELRATPGRLPLQLQQTPSKDEADDWETRVPRVGWTSEHLRLYTAVVKALHELQMARLALVGRKDEAVQRRLAVDTASRRVRRAMASVTWDLRLTHWLHATLQEHMPTPLLAIYLEVLQTLRAKVPTLVDQMLTLSTYNRLGVPVSEELLQLLQKPWDPAANSIAQHKPRKLPMDPVLVMVPSGIGSHIGHNSRRSRFWASQLSMLGRVAHVSTIAASLTGQSTVENMLDQLLMLTRAKIEELKSSAPNRPIVLFGWHVGAAIACQAALMETVAAVVCMGFPLTTLAGRRGQADDAILDLQSPVFFVIGQNAPTSRQVDLEELRERLRVQSGLLVVGSADERLRVSGAKKRSEGLTQAMVDRCILDEVGDFLGSILTQPVIPTPPPTPQAVRTNVDQSRRASRDSTSLDTTEAPEAKRSRSSTPVSSTGLTNASPAKILYSNAKQEAQLVATGRAGPKRVYEGSSSVQRVILGSSGEKQQQQRSSLGSRQSQTGITVNIGSLASLAPIGPIRLGSNDTSTSESSPSRTTVTTSRPATVRTPTSHPTITSLSSLLTSSVSKLSTNSVLLSSNPGGQGKVLGGEDAATTSSRRLDLSRVTLLTSGTTVGNLPKLSTTLRHLPAGTTLARVKPKVEPSPPVLLTSTSSTTSATRPAPSLSPSTILELPVIFAKDGEPDQFAALTAPLPVTLPDDMATLGGPAEAI